LLRCAAKANLEFVASIPNLKVGVSHTSYWSVQGKFSIIILKLISKGLKSASNFKRYKNMKINRLAVSLFFFTNGFQYASWVARLPEVQTLYGVSNTTLGTILLCSAAGAISAMPFAGILTVRFGSRWVTIATAIGFILAIPLIPLLSNLWLIGVLFFMLGVFGGSEDVAMNGQAVFVERLYKRSILSSFHGVWSIGTALGAGFGALFAKFGTPLFTHFLIISTLSLALILWAAFNLIKDDPLSIKREKDQKDQDEPTFRLPTKAILPLGIIAFCGMTTEGSVADWAAIYMHKTIGKDEAFSALAFGAFATAMTIGRLIGDYFTEKFGKRQQLIIASLLSIIGLALALAFNNQWTVLAGFFIVGLGISTIVPIIYSTAGNTEGVSPSVGIAMATTIGYSGFFVGPPVIGYLADIFSLRIGLLFSLMLCIVMLIFVLQKIRK
jgi:MFS family permease